MEQVNWKDIEMKYPVGSLLTGTVERHFPFGIFLDIGHPLVKGLVQIIDFLDEGTMTEELYPSIGTEVKAFVFGYATWNNQIKLGMKPSQLKQISVHAISY